MIFRPPVSSSPGRRAVLRAAAGLVGWPAGSRATEDARALLRTGGVVLALRHAHAPGNFDPPGFDLGRCATQRNLDDSGRAQARAIGDWFRMNQLVPSAVRSSPWCRCMETAQLAFGRAEAWPALGSVHQAADAGAQVEALRLALAQIEPRRFEIWVSHQFTLNALAGESTASGEGLVLQAAADRVVRVLARLRPA
jgi:broad specificity phosphatase PhoE